MLTLEMNKGRVLIGVAVLSVIIGAWAVLSPAQNGTVSDGPGEASDRSGAKGQQVPTQLVEIARWEGRATKNTQTFNIPSRQWRISWATRPHELGAFNFQIYVYSESGALVNVAANVIGADNDWTIMRGAGEYYLTINTAQPYVVVVETLQ